MQDTKLCRVIVAAVCVTACVGLAVAFPPPAPYYPEHETPQTGPGGEAASAEGEAGDAAAAGGGGGGGGEGAAEAAAGKGEGAEGQDGAHDGPPRSYHYQYAVHDPETGDVKSQNEVGDGLGTVRGTYSLTEPDGSTRVVEYTADDEHGFQAEVKRIGPQRKAGGGPQPPFDFAGLEDVLRSISHALPDGRQQPEQ